MLEQAEFTLLFMLSKTREVAAPHNALSYGFYKLFCSSLTECKVLSLLFVLSKAAEWRFLLKKGYVAIKRFHQTYEVEIAVLAVTAVYMAMLLAGVFWFFGLKMLI